MYDRTIVMTSQSLQYDFYWTKMRPEINNRKSADYLVPIIRRPIIDQSIIRAPLEWVSKANLHLVNLYDKDVFSIDVPKYEVFHIFS